MQLRFINFYDFAMPACDSRQIVVPSEYYLAEDVMSAAKMLADKIRDSAKMLRMMLDGLSIADHDLAEEVCEETIEILSVPGPGAKISQRQRSLDTDLSIDDFIIQLLLDADAPMAIDDILEAIVASEYLDVKKPSLAVKLHRMMKEKRITNPMRGRYWVSEIDRARHQRSGG